ncbi:MAG: thioredoxin-like domain-containing protein [Akkermansiaceae bacterium]|jgi:thiol-disulfide isomerase/thioredoxin|nr:thioredoxin-like domain-containing protein [Akkermansiaceae bacterium]MDP4646927.1 thioredoxin-like domain-containing protein [Akkermansiaceae bacterium]MDP4722341.1 thioredoxin-like domain-containing protein [Akkermansiaceae bacterium]MDP4781416.1 thioredoxin-like domain-containing protein [Akkermansiaceae bacterium]MDP4847484.1 thioredoxin-like domain-containing protein [Akkermansiaceae bacterium]
MKTTSLILAAAIISGTVHAEFRTWTRDDGKTADLELTETSGVDSEKIGRFKMRNGKTVDLPAEGFIDSDTDLINSWKPEASEESIAAAPSVFDDVLDGNLVKLDGNSVKRYELEAKPEKYYVFYYTASWCPPCQKYTPMLVDFYEKQKPGNGNFELVLITSDSDEGAMEGYAKDKKMPWPMLKLSKVEKFDKEFDHQVTGIPSVVVCDLEGNIVKKTTDLDSLEKLLK